MHRTIQLFILLAIPFCLITFADEPLIERVPYNVPLIKLSMMNNNTAVRVFKLNDDDYALITTIDDLYVKNAHDKVQKTTYKEYKHQAHYLSDFEIRYIILATRSLETTLDEFEHHLQQEHWGQCVYLDAFLPKFLKNYYMLLAIARNNPEKYEKQIALFEGKYEISINSKLSDQRVMLWMNDHDWLMKLRIASKELSHQLRLWEKRDLSNKNRNPEVVLSSKVEESLELFIKIYFGIKTPHHRYTSRNTP